ncbi:MAG: hypothetical protein AAF387_00395 [Pseudomonadota bacterium]
MFSINKLLKVVLLYLSLLASSTAATFSGYVGGSYPGDPFNVTSDSPFIQIASAADSLGARVIEMDYGIKVGGGGVGAKARIANSGFGGARELDVGASVLYEDLIFTPIRNDGGATSVDVLLNLSLGGFINLLPQGQAATFGSIAVMVNNVTIGSLERTFNLNGVDQINATGVLSGVSPNGSIFTNIAHPLSFALNTPVSLQFGIVVSAFVNGPDFSFAESDSDFFNTLSLDPNSVFTVLTPDLEVSIDSVSAGIANNQLAPIPLPASMLLMLPGWFVILRWRKTTAG